MDSKPVSFIGCVTILKILLSCFEPNSIKPSEDTHIINGTKWLMANTSMTLADVHFCYKSTSMKN